MDADPTNDPWVTDVPPGTTQDVIAVLVRAGLIDDLGTNTARQRWKKSLTFAFTHGIRTEAIPVPVLQILVGEARRILKGATPLEATVLRQTVRDAWNRDVDSEYEQSN